MIYFRATSKILVIWSYPSLGTEVASSRRPSDEILLLRVLALRRALRRAAYIHRITAGALITTSGGLPATATRAR